MKELSRGWYRMEAQQSLFPFLSPYPSYLMDMISFLDSVQRSLGNQGKGSKKDHGHLARHLVLLNFVFQSLIVAV
jgi:hypothetical protein